MASVASAPVGASKNQAVGEQLAGALLQVNKLLYKNPPSLSVATTRRMVSTYPQQRIYGSNETMVISFPTGSQYVDMANSYLTFDLRINFDDDKKAGVFANLGSGSCANLFSEVRVRSRSGVEISRLQGFDVWNYVQDRWTCDYQSFKNGEKRAQGYGNCPLTATGDPMTAYPAPPTVTQSSVLTANSGNGTGQGIGVRFCLPLNTIPCFKPIGGRDKFHLSGRTGE